MKKIYLASPFFDATECYYYHRAIEALRSAGYEVYVPQEHSIEGGWEMPNEEWARRVFAEDVDAIRTSDVVMILNFGMYSDSGTAWEAGYAYAMKIPTVQVLCGGANATYSLMMMNGCDYVVEFHNVANWEEQSAKISLDGTIQK